MCPLGQRQYRCEGGLQICIVFDLAANIVHHPAELRSQGLQRPMGTFKLLGMRVALVADQRDH